jgi:hypothetical protein
VYVFIRAKNAQTGEDENVNSRQIVRFRPVQGNDKQSVVALTNGESITLNTSCRSLRHAIQKANQPFEGSQSSAAAHSHEGEGQS